MLNNERATMDNKTDLYCFFLSLTSHFNGGQYRKKDCGNFSPPLIRGYFQRTVNLITGLSGCLGQDTVPSR